MKTWYSICVLLMLLSCGTQKKLSHVADKAVQEYLTNLNGVLINTPSNQSFLEALNEKHAHYKAYNSSPLKTTTGDTLKDIFSEKNMLFFKEQLKKPITWSEKSYVKQPIINQEDKNKYKIIYSLSQPVVTHNGNYVLMQFSLFNKRYTSGTDELLIFEKRKKKWVIYKRFELSLF